MSYLQEVDEEMRSADPEYDRIRAVDSFIAELSAARRARGLTQSQVADAAGIRQSHVSRIENFESHHVAFDTILRYANAVGMSFTLRGASKASAKKGSKGVEAKQYPSARSQSMAVVRETSANRKGKSKNVN